MEYLESELEFYAELLIAQQYLTNAKSLSRVSIDHMSRVLW